MALYSGVVEGAPSVGSGGSQRLNWLLVWVRACVFGAGDLALLWALDQEHCLFVRMVAGILCSLAPPLLRRGRRWRAVSCLASGFGLRVGGCLLVLFMGWGSLAWVGGTNWGEFASHVNWRFAGCLEM